MYTQCPHCQTCFRIAEDHLRIAGGKVRCGSCQEVFDATRHLFRNLTDRTPITDFQTPPRKPAPAPTRPQQAKPVPARPQQVKTPPARPQQAKAPPARPQQAKAPPAKSAPPPAPAPKSAESMRRERDKAPDQSRFMESVVGNDRYNDLDKMGAIPIPGDISFGDSIIKFANEPEAKTPTPARTPYEDFEDKEQPASDADRASLENFLAEVDSQLNEDETDQRSQLDKDIDELLAFANGLEEDKSKSGTGKPADNIEDEFDLDAVAEFEKELEATDTGKFKRPQEPAKDAAAMPPAAEEIEITPPAQEQPAAEKPASNSANEDKAFTDSVRLQAPELPESAAISEEDLPRALRRSLDMLDQAPRRSLGMTLLMILIALVLLGGLGFQAVMFRNVELAHMFPQLAPLLNQTCDRLPCRYGGKIDVSQIKLISRDVRSHPTQPNALLISATFVNQAPFDQPYPVIEITLYDLGGNVVASRRFTPQEYLEKMYNRFLLMESGTPVQVTLAVLDPGKDAINFEFSFH